METNRRILVVDDQEDLRDQVARILRATGGGGETASLIAQIRQRITRSAAPPPNPRRVSYEIDTVGQGREALEKVRESFSSHQPYALMFLDMRMPPGWDGMETAQRIRNIDREIQIVIMTAFADYDQAELAERIGEPDKLLYIKKPFQPEEIRQLALAMTEKWNMSRREKDQLILTNRLMRENSTLARQGFQNLDRSYRSILASFMSFLESRGGVLVRRHEGQVEVCAATSPEDSERLQQHLRQHPWNGTPALDEKGLAVIPIHCEGFDGAVCVEGKGLVFGYDVLHPFLDILVETSREVLIHSFLLSEQDEHRRMGSLGRAASRIARHVSNAVGSMQQQADTLSQCKDAAERARLGREIHHCGDQVLALSQELMAYSSGFTDDLLLAEDSLRELLERCLDHAGVRAADGPKLTFDVPQDLRLTADLALLEKAFEHLLRNAVEALRGQPDGEITISAERRSGQRPMFELHLADNGPGVPPEIRDEVFEPFVSGKPGGRGLGGAIARQVFERHGGSIALTASAEDGAHFTILLPCRGPAAGSSTGSP